MEICLNKKPRAIRGSCYTSHCNIQKQLADKIVKLLELIFGTIVAISKYFEGADKKNYYMHFVRGKAQARLGSTREFPDGSVVKIWWFHC